MKLTKTNYIQFLNCPKSLWLLKNKPHCYPKSKSSKYEEKLAAEGYEVQKLVETYLTKKDPQPFLFEEVFETNEGLYAKADIIRKNEDGSVNVYEVKSTGRIHDQHLIDAAFQELVIEKTGISVKSIYIVHLNKDYIRGEKLDLDKILVFSKLSWERFKLKKETKERIRTALNLLKQETIDETSCSCLKMSKSHHCETFDYFNPDVPKPSIYNLPRLHKNKILKFSNEKKYDLSEIDENEVSINQLNVLQSAKRKKPIINIDEINKFYKQVEYPLYFLDYETYSSAIPIVKGIKPHDHIPFQYSLHIIENDQKEEITHFEYLAENAELPLNFIKTMERQIGSKGSIITWHKSFEKTRNKEMGILYPNKALFLNNISDRIIDLEDIFKNGYVDIAFDGSTSIKKVLPVIIPELTYQNMAIANGTDAMEAFIRMIKLRDINEKIRIRNDMLEYCKLDTLAMVKIYKRIKKIYTS